MFIYIEGLEVKKTAFFGGTREFFVNVFLDGAFKEEPQVLDFATQNLGRILHTVRNKKRKSALQSLDNS